MTMTIDEQIKIFESNSEFERKDGDLQGCLNFRQLAEWLKDYKRLLDKETPNKKVVKNNSQSYRCGNCGTEVSKKRCYCYTCGQRILTDEELEIALGIIDRHISGKD